MLPLGAPHKSCKVQTRCSIQHCTYIVTLGRRQSGGRDIGGGLYRFSRQPITSACPPCDPRGPAWQLGMACSMIRFLVSRSMGSSEIERTFLPDFFTLRVRRTLLPLQGQWCAHNPEDSR